MAIQRKITDDSVLQHEAFNYLKGNPKHAAKKLIQTSIRVEQTSYNKLIEITSDMGIGISAGIRYAINEFIKSHS